MRQPAQLRKARSVYTRRFSLFGIFFGFRRVRGEPAGFEVFGSSARLQYLAIAKNTHLNGAAGFTVPERAEADGDFIPGLERISPPAVADHVDGGLRLADPMRHFAAIGYVKPEEAMRIGPKPLGDGPFHGDGFLGVQRRVGMVCEKRSHRHQKDRQHKRQNMPISHCDSLHQQHLLITLAEDPLAPHIAARRIRCWVYFCEIGTPEVLLAFSAARAPARMLTISLFPSAHAYSNMGPFIAPSATIAVQGLVDVCGSSPLTLYSIVFCSVPIN